MSRLDRQDRIIQSFGINVAKNDMIFHYFFSLNISKSGLLIAADTCVDFSKNDILHVFIDPWKLDMGTTLACRATVKRLAKGDSKGLEEYIALTGCPPGTKSIFGIEIDHMPDKDYRNWCAYIDYFFNNVSSIA